MVKAYLRYIADCALGQIAGEHSNILLFDKGIYIYIYIYIGKYCIVAANEEILVYTTSNWEIVRRIVFDNIESQVCVMEINEERHLLAVGYRDGSIRIIDLINWELLHKFPIHSSPISCLKFDSQVSNIYFI